MFIRYNTTLQHRISLIPELRRWGILSTAACNAEEDNDYRSAAILWAKAEKFASQDMNKKVASLRSSLCRKKCRSGVVPDNFLIHYIDNAFRR